MYNVYDESVFFANTDNIEIANLILVIREDLIAILDASAQETMGNSNIYLQYCSDSDRMVPSRHKTWHGTAIQPSAEGKTLERAESVTRKPLYRWNYATTKWGSKH